MYRYFGAKMDDYSTGLIIKTDKKYNMGDIYYDEYKDIDPFTNEKIHVIYGKYLIIEEY